MLHADAVAVDEGPLRVGIHADNRLRRQRAGPARDVLQIAVDQRGIEDERLIGGTVADARAAFVAVKAQAEAASHHGVVLTARVPGKTEPRLRQELLPVDAALQIAGAGQAHAVREIARAGYE